MRLPHHHIREVAESCCCYQARDPEKAGLGTGFSVANSRCTDLAEQSSKIVQFAARISYAEVVNTIRTEDTLLNTLGPKKRSALPNFREGS